MFHNMDDARPQGIKVNHIDIQEKKSKHRPVLSGE